jgi:arylsulfatase A-like enzyme
MPAPSATRILVVTLDRLPAWILPAYGSTWVAMPAVDSLAARGLVFDRVIATGDDDLATLRDVGLDDIGSDAIVVTDASHVAEAVGGGDGGATVRLVEARPRQQPETDAATTNLARLMAAAHEAMIAGRHGVVWVHAASLGVAWDAPGEGREAYADPEDPPPYAGAAVPEMTIDADTDPDLVVGMRQAFAGQLTHLDACLGPLFAAATGWHVLVAGVRGLGLGLHGRLGTGPMAPFGELVHVPAILADATGRMAAQRYGGLVVPADLGATLRVLRGAAAESPEAIAPWQGRSLAGLLADWSAPARDRVVVATARGAAIVTPGWHLVAEADRPPRLFHKPDDYFELCDVADRCPAVVEELAPLAAAAATGDVGCGWLVSVGEAARGG